MPGLELEVLESKIQFKNSQIRLLNSFLLCHFLQKVKSPIIL